MTTATNAASRTCLKSNNTINVSSFASVSHIIYEGITKCFYLNDFDKKNIESFPTTYKEKIPAITNYTEADITDEPSVTVINISLVVIRQWNVAVKASKYYTLIGRMMNAINMNYGNVLSSFKIEWDIYKELEKQDDPNVLVINDNDNDSKVIKCMYTFTECLS